MARPDSTAGETDPARFTFGCVHRAQCENVATINGLDSSRYSRCDWANGEFGSISAREGDSGFTHRRISSPLLRIDASAASSIRTTRSPAWPSLKGVLLFTMQSAK